ncbi:MAG TPA: hypothetical protein VMT63_02990 [Bacteroidales bacterium]|nr:hypothetical protein [Bacteroidales bacterium]
MKKVLLLAVLFMSAMIINAQTRTVVKTADLPKALTENVAKDYAGFTIKEATKVVTNNVVTFEVVVVKGTTTDTLVYDKDGKFVKKVTAKTGTPEKKDNPPATKQNPPATKQNPPKK